MIWFIITMIVALGLWAALHGYKKWGASNERRKQAERRAEDRREDAEIASKPFVDSPFGRMRRKK